MRKPGKYIRTILKNKIDKRININKNIALFELLIWVIQYQRKILV